MASIPKPFTLNINVGDFINYKGQQVKISAVSVGVDDNLGNIVYTLTLVASGNPVVTVSASNCVLNNPGTEAASTGVQVWSRNGSTS